MKIKCVKCGKEKEFKSTSQIWTEGWNPINKNEYVCDKCPQTSSFDDLDFLPDCLPSELPIIEPEITEPHRQKNKKIVV
jgi:DNA-directed RNA polymerase subunit RPC12/RpoP